MQESETVEFKKPLVESWGRGIPLILEKAPSTRFSIEAGLFVSTLQRSEEMTKGSENASGTTQKTTHKTSGKIIEAIRDNSQITIPELARQIGITDRSVERKIQKLRQAGCLVRKEGAKGGHWEILNPKSPD